MSEPAGHEAAAEVSDPGDLDPTGVPAVDQAMAELDGLGGAPLAEHHERLHRAHVALQGALDADRPAPPG